MVQTCVSGFLGSTGATLGVLDIVRKCHKCLPHVPMSLSGDAGMCLATPDITWVMLQVSKQQLESVQFEHRVFQPFGLGLGLGDTWLVN